MVRLMNTNVPQQGRMKRVMDNGTTLLLLIVGANILVNVPVFKRKMPTIHFKGAPIPLTQLVIEFTVKSLKHTEYPLNHLRIGDDIRLEKGLRPLCSEHLFQDREVVCVERNAL